MSIDLPTVAARQGGVFTVGQAARAGYTRAMVRHRLHTRSWRRVRRGVLAREADVERLGEFPLACQAALLVLPETAVFCGTTAARLWALPFSGRQPDDGLLHVTIPGAKGRRFGEIVIHRCVRPVVPQKVFGLPTTPLARTVVDVATVLPFAEAVVVADGALLGWPPVGGQLTAELLQLGTHPGARAAMAAVDFADPLCESVLESLARVVWHLAGLPAPRTQAVVTRDRRFLARVDFLWEEQRLVVEVDGLAKYVEPGRIGREKARTNALVDAGYRVLHFTWGDIVRRPDHCAALVARALGIKLPGRVVAEDPRWAGHRQPQPQAA